jgi:hypothetical protein
VRYKLYRKSVSFAAALVIVACALPAHAQESATTSGPQNGERRTEGTVASVGHGSMTVYTDDGKYVVFVAEPASVKKEQITQGSRVRVFTSTSDNEPAPTALAIDKLPPREGLAPQNPEPVPLDLRQLEAQVQRQARRWHLGLTGGVALDPEMISLNAFATLQPFSQRSLSIRPNFELAFGEVTTLLGLHLDVLFALPGISRSARWAPYIGAGPNFSLSHRSVDEEEFLGDDATAPPEEEDSRFDFSQFDWNNGFNFIVGMRRPNGMFFEMKATAYGVANIRMLGGFAF